MSAPKVNDIAYDMARSLHESASGGGDRSYSVQWKQPGLLRVTATDIDTLDKTTFVITVTEATS